MLAFGLLLEISRRKPGHLLELPAEVFHILISAP